jgi:hypothetical protein
MEITHSTAGLKITDGLPRVQLTVSDMVPIDCDNISVMTCECERIFRYYDVSFSDFFYHLPIGCRPLGPGIKLPSLHQFLQIQLFQLHGS